MEHNKKNKSASVNKAGKPHPASRDNRDKYNAPKPVRRQEEQEPEDDSDASAEG